MHMVIILILDIDLGLGDQFLEVAVLFRSLY